MVDLKTQLQPIFDPVGYENAWRPIYDRENKLVARGRGRFDDIIPETLQSVDFYGKTIVDVGCNFGYHTLLGHIAGLREWLESISMKKSSEDARYEERTTAYLT